jgi:filamentous hemagglutinin family protein
LSAAAGNVNIVTVSPNQLDIVQSSKKAIINWGDFSIGSGETTNFLQPGRNSWTLNRVTGGNPSEILGSLHANGNVLLLNQNGILFGPNSRIDVGGLVASTANIKDTDFLSDRFRFEGAPQGSTVINQGHITVAEGGLAAFVAPGVANSGVIEAKLGKVSLASGTAFTLDLYGDGLVSLALDGEVTQAPVGPDGTPLPALVTNDGRITADGGRVLLTAEAAKGVVDSVINMSGVIEAKSVGRDAKGTIVLAGGDNGLVEVSGKLNASSAEAGSARADREIAPVDDRLFARLHDVELVGRDGDDVDRPRRHMAVGRIG